MNFLAVFIGGGLGSLCRYGISQISFPYFQHFPIATLTANVLASACLAFIVAALALKAPNESQQFWKLLLATGFCGGFSTFSTFSLESFQLLKNGQTTLAIAYIFISVTLCLLACFLAWKLLR